MSRQKRFKYQRALPASVNANGYEFNQTYQPYLLQGMRQLPVTIYAPAINVGDNLLFEVALRANEFAIGKRLIVDALINYATPGAAVPGGSLWLERIYINGTNAGNLGPNQVPGVIGNVGPYSRYIPILWILWRESSGLYAADLGASYASGPLARLGASIYANLLTLPISPIDFTQPITLGFYLRANQNAGGLTMTPVSARALIESPVNIGRLP